MKTTTSLVALLLGGIMAGGTALAQDAGFRERLDRLESGTAALGERMGGGSVQVAQAIQPSLAADFEIRLQRMERALSELTGKYEESVYQSTQLKDRLERMNSDMDFRLSQLEKGGSTAMAAAPSAPTAPAKTPEKTPDKGAPATAAKPGDKPADAKGAQTAALPPGNPEKQYEHAFELLRDSDYDKAERAFTEFLSKNKGHQLAGNAQYWLGETYYVRKKYTEAAVAFAEGFQKYPKNSKAPDNLLKLGMSMAQLNQKNDACTAFGQLLTKFPEASASVKRRADTERKRLNCPG